MKNNVGRWDRNLRWVVGGTAAVAALTVKVPLGLKIGLLVLGAAELITASVRYCPSTRSWEWIRINNHHARQLAKRRKPALAVDVEQPG